jgi:dTDP-4-amino-4,6-dideoxygalactose transaminase
LAAYWVQSGTAALALALMLARHRRPEVEHPKVLLPAYGCPDLVAAAEFAGVQPVLVDIHDDDPGYRLESLAGALDVDTVAVVAVNFLGIRERLAGIREVLRAHPGVVLIEDDAQWFPESPQATPAGASELAGDMVCVSFGRGKPVSLLGGGALLLREPQPEAAAAIAPAVDAGPLLRLKAALFNALLNPHLYWLVNRNPLFELGQTRFKPLQAITALDGRRLGSLQQACTLHLRRANSVGDAWAAALASLPGLMPLVVGDDRCGRWLRYPVLCRDGAMRDRLWRALRAEGVGASAMYLDILAEVPGVADKIVSTGDYPGARAFADRLLTLPVHERVGPRVIARVVAIVQEVAGRG